MTTSVLADLVVNLIGNDSELLAASRRSAAALEKTAGAATGVGASIAKAGKFAGLALVGIGAYSVEAASKFQAAMELVHTQAGSAQSEVQSLSQQVLNLASTVGIGPDKLAEGLYHIESAGFRGQQAMDILTMAAKNAATGMSDMEDASQAMVGSMAVGFKDVRDAADAAAYLNRIVGIGDMRMQQLSSAIATGVMPTFKEAGLGMTDFGAALATLTDNVTPANQAATRLRMTIALLGAPSKAAFTALTAVGLGADAANKALANRSYLEKYGINISKLSEDLQKPDGLLVAVKDLNSHLAGLDPTAKAAVIERAFGGGRTSAAIQTLLSQQDRLQSKYDALGTSASRAKDQQEDWAKTQGTFRQQANQLGASLQVMAIQLGTKLLPPLTKFVSYLTSHKAEMMAFFATLLIFLGLLTVAWIAMGIAAIAASWEILLIIAAVAVVAFGIYELVKHWKTVWKFIKDIALDVWHWLVNTWNSIWKQVMGVVNWIKSNIINPIVNFFKRMAKDFELAWKGLLVVVNWVKNNIFKPIADFAWNWMLLPLRLVMDLLIFAFKFAWGFVSTIITDTWNAVIHPVVNFIINLFKQFITYQKEVWDEFVRILKGVWNFMVTVRNGIMNDFVNPVIYLIKNYLLGALKGAWDLITNDLKTLGSWFTTIWDGIKGAVEGAWNFLRPIFDKIQGAFHDIQGALSSLNPGALGSAVAKLFHFAEGGLVPGPKGRATLAVVHGGEYVLNTDQVGAIRSAGVTAIASSSTRSGTVTGGGTDDRPIVVQVHLDGRQIYQTVITQAQRRGRRNNSTGVAKVA